MRFRLPKTCAALLLAVAGCGDPAPAAGPTPWKMEVEDASVRVDPQVVTVGPKDVWVFGGRGSADKTRWPTARHWNGKSWSKADLPGGRIGAVRAAGASSTSDVWAVTESGADGTVLRWDGARWTVAQHLPGFSVTDMEVFSPQDIRLYGTGERTSGGLCWSHTASGWSKTTLPFMPSHTSARSARDVWALTFEGTLHHYNGLDWKEVPLGDVLPSTKRHHLMERGHLLEITATADGIWITVEDVGGIPSQKGSAEEDDFPYRPMAPPGPDLSSLLLHGDPTGNRWTAESIMGKTGRLSQFGAPIIDADGGVWLIGSFDVNAYESALAYRTPTGTWTRTKIRTSRFRDFEVRAFARIPGSTRFLVAGRDDERGAILSTR
ncbi:MAG: hypothetical protein JWN52_279 [Actinomycetia bacterium]|nr:hypothetical protein [Actinomycetes bacterium]